MHLKIRALAQTRIRIAAISWAVLALCCTPCGAQKPQTTLPGLDFPTEAAARAVWKPMGGSDPVSIAVVENRKALRLPCRFEQHTERASWDLQVNLDLSSGSAIEFQMLCRDASPVSYFSIYFQSGEGWYHGTFFPESQTGWNTVSFDRASLGVEGKPAGWRQIKTIRVSAWRGQDKNTEFFLADLRQVGVLGQDASIAVLRCDSLARQRPEERRNVEQFTETVARHLRASEIGCVILSDEEIVPSELNKAKVLVLPYNPSMPEQFIGEVGGYLQSGGKVLAFYSLPDRVTALLGLADGTHTRADNQGNFSSIRFGTNALPGAPTVVGQNSWNIQSYKPSPGRTRVLAEWFDADGKPTGHPAVLGSTNFVLMTHVLLPDDPVNKSRMLLAMVGALAPELWRDAAEAAWNRIGKFSAFDGYDAARVIIGDLAGDDISVTSTLNSVHGMRGSARHLLSTGDFAGSIGVSAEAARLMQEAFCRAQKPLPGEFRAFWCHSAFGVQGMDWEEAISYLAQNGFTSILPNMLWGGVAFYPSKVLPVAPEVANRGDQVAKCLAACRKHGIQVHVWKVNWNLGHAAPKEFVERKREERRLQFSSSGKEEPWLCPSHPENRKLEIDSMVELARLYEIDGIHFDYIRYPDSDHCYCAGCRERFQKATGNSPQTWPRDVLRDGPLRQSWLGWRRGNITAVVQAVSEQARAARPKLRISAAVFPNWTTERDNIGQDWKLWCEKGYLDFVCPMDYTTSNSNFENMVKKQVAWAGKTPCYPGIGASASTSRFGADKVIDQINIARRNTTGGFVVFNYGVGECKELLPMLGLGITRKQ
jgi:uncharacterized lipoprotein YddW (UPF0748 family)